jgi:hypothetical protein
MTTNKTPPAELATGAAKTREPNSTWPDTQRASAALSYIPADDRDTWISMGMALKDEFGDEAFELWDQWSRTADSYSPSDARAQWRSLKRGRGITIRTLFYEAKRCGWREEGSHRHQGPWAIAPSDDREANAQRARAHGSAILSASLPLLSEHPYLKSHGVGPIDCLRQIDAAEVASITGYEPKARGEPLVGRLIVVPLENAHGFVGIELIDEEGRKAVLYGTQAKGAFWTPLPLPDDEPGRVLIGEGMATMLSAYAATNAPCIAARFAGNLPAIAAFVRERFPHAEIVVLGEEGGGLPHAEKAARDAKARLAIFQGDANDLYMAAGEEAVREKVDAAQFVPEPGENATFGHSLRTSAEAEEWPSALDSVSYYGLPGEIVRAIEPHTESDPAAILIQTLAAFGALVGRGPHVRIEADEHHPRIFTVTFGQSAKARKGTSWGRVSSLFKPVPGWPRVVDGLSSGEGLKYAVRDPIVKPEKDGTATEIDPGVADKRLMVVESEFAQVLRQCARPGNTLSATIRSLWDNGNLQSLTKNDPITATGAHVCLIGHITADELRAELTATDSSNGFANRFLYMAVARSKMLPFGGEELDPEVEHRLSNEIASAARIATTRSRMHFTPAARDAWMAAYPELSEGHKGMFGAVTARAEAQTLRLSLLYALMDKAASIDLPHLLAALAVWERCEASARYVFGGSLGDRLADAIAPALRSAPHRRLSRTQISELFSKNEPASKISAALHLLESRGIAVRHKTEGPGRPAEIWTAT